MQMSQRLLEVAKREQYLLNEQSIFKDTPAWQRFLSPQIGSLALKWSSSGTLKIVLQTKPELVECAYLEAFAELASNLSWGKIQVLGVRELENFLRDHNHAPAHDDLGGRPAGLWLEFVRQAAFKTWLIARMEGSKLSTLSNNLSDVMPLAQALSHFTPEFWGPKAPKNLAQSVVGNVFWSHEASLWEIQWRFHADVSGEEALILCQALELVCQARGLRVKVVAES